MTSLDREPDAVVARLAALIERLETEVVGQRGLLERAWSSRFWRADTS